MHVKMVKACSLILNEYEGIQNDQNALKSNDQEQQEQPKKNRV